MADTNHGNNHFEAALFKTADKLRKNIDAAEYKNVMLGLIFLKYISDSFQELYERLEADEYSDPEDRDEYIAENCFFVPEIARWKSLQAKAKLRLMVKRLLKRYGYPPDLIMMVADKVLEQSDVLASECSH